MSLLGSVDGDFQANAEESSKPRLIEIKANFKKINYPAVANDLSGARQNIHAFMYTTVRNNRELDLLTTEFNVITQPIEELTNTTKPQILDLCAELGDGIKAMLKALIGGLIKLG